MSVRLLLYFDGLTLPVILVGREAVTMEAETESSAYTVMESSSSECQSEVDSSSVDHSASGNCECQCCSNVCTPHQSSDLSQSKRIHSHLSKEKQCDELKVYSRKIQPSWYNKFPWISVCTSTYRIYCSLCRNAKHNNLLVLCKKHTSPFVDEGFSNWRKAIQRFSEHEKSEMHKESTVKLSAMNSSINIASQLNSQLESDQKFHREMFLIVLSSVRYLARQGLPLRSHLESGSSFEGILYQLLLLRSTDFSGLKSWLQKREFISPEIINELIVLMGQAILRQILSEIKTCLWFGIIADEATDIAHNEQMSISIRSVSCDYEIHENTIGLIQLPDTKAQTLFSVIKDVLLRCSLPLHQCIGQAYDGAANMSGIRNGVQARFKSEANRALYVHCLAHSLNLCLQSVTKKCDFIQSALYFIYELVQLIKFSPKRLSLFDRLRREIAVNTGEVQSPSLRTLCPTRWTIRHCSINSVLVNYSLIGYS